VRGFLTGLTYLVSLLVVAALSLGTVLLVAGPHSGLLPGWLEGVVLALGWIAIFLVPMLPTRWVWRRLGARAAAAHSRDET
jgi:hypothetical protein